MTEGGEPEEPLPGDCCGEGCASCVWDMYRERLRKWQASQHLGAASPALSKVHFTPCTLTTITALTNDTCVYRFETATPSSARLVLQPGQHLEMRRLCENDEIIRKYSPISWVDNHFDVIIKRYKTGKMSAYLETVKEGEQVDWRGPYGHFKYSSSDQDLLLILCAGTGIAPMLPVVRSITSDADDDTVVRLLCGCSSLETRWLLPELKELSDFWNFSYCHHVTGDEGSPGWGEEVIRGRISAEDVACEASKTNVRVLVCGPDSFCTDMKDAATKVGAQCYCF